MVVAQRQRCGRGQQGRVWQSPAGGLWLSAAFPWSADPERGAAPALALALGLALELEQLGGPGRELGVAIKWPNDILVGDRKLAGLLPRLRLRGGRVRWAQLGLGLNGINRVPPGAIALAEVLRDLRSRPGGRRRRPFDPRATPRALEGLAQRAITRSLSLAQNRELVRRQAEQRLWRPATPILRQGVAWYPAGLLGDGGLRVRAADGRQDEWHRDF